MTAEQWKSLRDSIPALLEGGEVASREVEKAKRRFQPELLDLFDELRLKLAQAPKMHDLPQAVDAWQILAPLADGSLGTSFLVEPMGVTNPTPCVLKLFREPIQTPIARQQFDEAVGLMELLDSNHSPKILDVGVTRLQFAYLVYPYISGVDLKLWSESREWEERFILLVRVVESMSYAHQRKVMHLGLKPTEILVDNENRPWILGLGNKRAVAENPGAVETPEALLYASPEQVTGQEAGPTADVFALGVMIQELLTGEHPFGGHNKSVLDLGRAICDEEPKPADKLGLSLRNVLSRAMAKAPRERYPNAEELFRDLKAVLDGNRGDTKSVKPSADRSWIFKLAAALAVLVLTVVFGFYAWNKFSSKSAEEVSQKVQVLSNSSAVSAGLWQDVKNYLSGIEVRETTPADVLQESARGWLQLAESQQGPPNGLTPDLPGALDSANHSIEAAAELRHRDPASEAFLLDYARASGFSRDLNIRLFHLPDATLTAERNYAALRERPTENERLIESRAVNSTVLADLKYWDGNLDSALTFRQDAFSQFERLAKKVPNDPLRLRNFARSAERLASANSDLSKGREALVAVGVAEPLDRRFSQQEPDKAMRWIDLAATLSEKARAFEWFGNERASIEAARESRRAIERAIDIAPNDENALTNLIRRQLEDAGFAYRRKDYRESVRSAEKAKSVVEEMSRRTGGRLDFDLMLAQAVASMGDALSGIGGKSEAKRYYSQAQQILETASRKAPLRYPEKKLLDRVKNEQ